jgi:hypothetical protein
VGCYRGGQGFVTQNAGRVRDKVACEFVPNFVKEGAVDKEMVVILNGLTTEPTEHQPIIEMGCKWNISGELMRAGIKLYGSRVGRGSPCVRVERRWQGVIKKGGKCMKWNKWRIKEGVRCEERIEQVG